MMSRFFLLLIITISFYGLAQGSERSTHTEFLSSKQKSEVYAGQLIDAGEYEDALVFIPVALEFYPRSDHMLMLLGQAYYESKYIEKAENYFMQALRINPLNQVAKAYVEVIRETSKASISTNMHELRGMIWSISGDITVFGLGVFFGGLMGSSIKRFVAWKFTQSARETFLKGDYDDFADMLEIQLTTNELKPLRSSLAFMLEHKSKQECIDLLNNYVNTEDHLKSLTRMLILNESKSRR